MSLRQKIAVGAVSILAMVGVAVNVVLPVEAIVCAPGSARGEVEVGNVADCNVPVVEGENSSLPMLVVNIINIIIGVLGIAAVAVVIYGAVQMVLSQGDPGKVKTGRSAIIYGVVGLVIALLAFAIVNFVLGSISV